MTKRNSSLIKVFTNICLLTSFFFVFQIIMFGQAKEKDKTAVSNPQIEDESNIPSIGPTNCESLRAHLEMYILNGKKLDEGSQIIIIFKLNKKETTKYYNSRRHDLETWFRNYYPNKYTITKGDSADDLGRAEIYVNGKKSFIIEFAEKYPKLCKGLVGFFI